VQMAHVDALTGASPMMATAFAAAPFRAAVSAPTRLAGPGTAPRVAAGRAAQAERSTLLAAVAATAAAGVCVSGSRRSKQSAQRRLVRVSRAAGGDQPGTTEKALAEVARGRVDGTKPKVPTWLFRQAGRHLPEYTQYKKDTGKNFLQLLDDPKDVAECTMQPLRRYPVDAAILFSDILVIAEALGIEVQMPGGVGILVPNPLEGPEDIKRLPSVAEAGTAAFVEDKLSHVLGAVKLIVETMEKEGMSGRTLIGFSAAPWTLLFYMVGGSSKKRTDQGEFWLKNHEAESKELFKLLTAVVIEYLSGQVRAGAQALQVFEAMGEFISEESFYKWAMPAMKEIATELKRRHPEVPLMVFPRGACYSLAALQSAGYDVVTADTQTDLGAAAKALQEEAAKTGTRVATLQGNFDPKWLRVKSGGTVEKVREEVKAMYARMGEHSPGLIANLGEGLNGTESTELVAAFVEAVHEL